MQFDWNRLWQEDITTQQPVGKKILLDDLSAEPKHAQSYPTKTWYKYIASSIYWENGDLIDMRHYFTHRCGYAKRSLKHTEDKIRIIDIQDDNKYIFNVEKKTKQIYCITL